MLGSIAKIELSKTHVVHPINEIILKVLLYNFIEYHNTEYYYIIRQILIKWVNKLILSYLIITKNIIYKR